MEPAKISFCEIFGVVQFSTFATLSARSGSDQALFDHLVVAGEQERRHGEAPGDRSREAIDTEATANPDRPNYGHCAAVTRPRPDRTTDEGVMVR